MQSIGLFVFKQRKPYQKTQERRRRFETAGLVLLGKVRVAGGCGYTHHLAVVLTLVDI